MRGKQLGKGSVRAFYLRNVGGEHENVTAVGIIAFSPTGFSGLQVAPAYTSPTPQKRHFFFPKKQQEYGA